MVSNFYGGVTAADDVHMDDASMLHLNCPEEYSEEERNAYSQFNPNQTDEDRYHIRKQYEILIQNTKGALDGTETKSAKELAETIKQAGLVYKDVQYSREGVRDSELINICSAISRKKALELQTDQRRFDPVEFAAKLKAFYCGDEHDPLLDGPETEVTSSDNSSHSTPTPTNSDEPKGAPITIRQWAKVGRYAYSLLRDCPGLSYLNGSFDPSEVEVKVHQRRETGKRAKIAQEKRLEEASDEEGALEKTTRTVDAIARKMKKYCRKHGCVSYFKVVLDPKDFGRTIENMFHVAFLIKDHILKLDLDDQGIPVLSAVDENKEVGTTSEMKQCVATITMSEWEELNRLYGIREPFIPVET